MNVYLIISCDSIDGPWDNADVYKSRAEALARLEEEYENLCPTDGDLDIEYDPEEGTLSWIDADMGCKVWVCIQEIYLNRVKEIF